MDKDRVEGGVHQVKKGTVAEAVGKVTGDANTQPKAPRERRRGERRQARYRNAVEHGQGGFQGGHPGPTTTRPRTAL
jgi:uncharacterized protein YjbJ (UPF0337 family)